MKTETTQGNTVAGCWRLGMPPYRRNGKTFRTLLTALLNASLGKTVEYQSGNPASAYRNLNKITDIARSFLEDEFISVNRARREFCLKNGGKVKFTVFNPHDVAQRGKERTDYCIGDD